MAIKWLMGILYRDAHVLIGNLRHKNMLIPRLQWTFPFTKIRDDESPRKAAKRLFKEELGMDIEVGQFILKYVPSENPKVEQFFYEIKLKKAPKVANVISSKRFLKFGWIKPTQILKYFTTSISKEVMDYLRSLEDTGKGFILK